MKDMSLIKKALKIFVVFIFLFHSAVSGFTASAMTLSQRVSGMILIQVHVHGEAWYVNPKNGQRYYMGRAEDAYSLMRGLGIGITNADLNKIPVAEANFAGGDSDGDGLSDRIEESFGTNIGSKDSDNDGYSDKVEILSNHNPLGYGTQKIDLNFAKIQSGKIFLQVQAHGEAWYVYPDNLKRYYLGTASDAYALMRLLGLGITNENLDLIPINANFSNLPAPIAIAPQPELIISPVPQPEPIIIPVPQPEPIVIPEPLPEPVYAPAPQPEPIIVPPAPNPPVVVVAALPEPPRLANVVVTLADTPVKTITGCQTISESGRYVLGNDLASEDGYCLTFKDTQDISLDCQGHKISRNIFPIFGVASFSGLNNFKVSSCIFNGNVLVENSQNGIIENNTIGMTDQYAWMDANNNSYLNIKTNNFLGSYQQTNGHYNQIKNNVFNPTILNAIGSCVIISNKGANNEIMFNEIDGKSNGIMSTVSFSSNIGFDDGICLSDEIEDRIESNNIYNNFDAGIETIGSVTKTIMQNNSLNNNTVGIGGWYWNSWRDNTVKNNTVNNANKIFHFFRGYGLRTEDTVMYFLNNQFINNKLINPRGSYPGSTFYFPVTANDFALIFSSQDPTERLLTPETVIIGNNLLMNNNFTTTTTPLAIQPGSAFLNGGGNICNTTDAVPADYPITCGN